MKKFIKKNIIAILSVFLIGIIFYNAFISSSQNIEGFRENKEEIIDIDKLLNKINTKIQKFQNLSNDLESLSNDINK